MHWRETPPPKRDREELWDSLTGFAFIVVMLAAVAYLATHLG